MKALALPFSLFLFACGSTAPSVEPTVTPPPVPSVATEITQETIETEVDAWLAANASGYAIEQTEGELTQHCPVGVNCDASFTYFAVMNRAAGLYLSFDGDALNNMTLEGLREHVSYLNFNRQLMTRGDWVVQLVELSPIDKANITIESFENGVITLVGTSARARLIGTNTTPECEPMADGPMADGCGFSRIVDLPITVRVSMAIPSEGLDCSGDTSGDHCG